MSLQPTALGLQLGSMQSSSFLYTYFWVLGQFHHSLQLPDYSNQFLTLGIAPILHLPYKPEQVFSSPQSLEITGTHKSSGITQNCLLMMGDNPYSTRMVVVNARSFSPTKRLFGMA